MPTKATAPCEECFPGGWPIAGVEPGGRICCQHGAYDAPPASSKS